VPGAARVVRIPARGDLRPSQADRLRPLEDPAGAWARIEEILCSALELPRAPWEPGVAVTFDSGGRVLLDQLREGDCEGARRALGRAGSIVGR